MSVVMRLAAAGAVAAAAVICLAAPASADPGDDSCSGVARLVCAFIPTLPNLDHDIDLTKDPGALDGAVSDAPEGTQPVGSPPADSCIGGCF
jgi:hypothetical protein